MSLSVSQGCSTAAKEEEEFWVELCGEKTEFEIEQDRAREASISSHADRNFFKELTPDIRDLLQQLLEWKTDDDFKFAISRYCGRRVEQECVEKELKAMKELSYALSCKHNDSIKVSEALAKSAADLCCGLVEQVPGVKDMLEYETLFSGAQKLCIEKALAEKLQKEKQTAVNLIRDSQEAAIRRLKALHAKLLDIEDKSCEERDRCAALGRLCSTVNHFVEILEARLHRPRGRMLAAKQAKNLKRGRDHTRKDHKRPKLAHPTKKSGKLEEREDERIKKASALMKEKYDGVRQVMREVQGNGVEKDVASERVFESSFSVRDSSLAGNMSNEKTMEINSGNLVSESVIESSCVLRDSSMGGHMSNKKTMEINPENAIMEELRKRSDADMNDKFVRDLSLLLFEIASLTSGCGLTKRKSLAVSQGYTTSQGEQEEMDARKQICTNKQFYLVGVVTVEDCPYAGPNFFKQLPADIRDLLQKFPECQTIEDLEIAMSKHRNWITEPECLLMDLENDLKALKELSSALDCKYASCVNNIQELGMSAAVVYRELVEQFPGINNIKEYETLFTGDQRFSIGKALEAKLREDILTSVNPQGAPEIRLMEFQKKLVANENKSVEESNRRKILVRLCSTVKYSANTLESRLHLVDDGQIKKREGWEDYSGKDCKRKRLEWPTREVRKLEESEDRKKKKVETSIKEKFEGLCKVIKEVLGDRIEKVVVSECVVGTSCFSTN